MARLARQTASRYPGLVEVQQRRREDVHEEDTHDVAVALGVFDYVHEPAGLLRRRSRAAPVVIGSFPGPGLRPQARKVRYGAHGVRVHPYPLDCFERLGAGPGLLVTDVFALGRAGHVVEFQRGRSGARLAA